MTFGHSRNFTRPRMSAKWQHSVRQFSVSAVVGLCLALILSTGPQIQTYLLSLLNSNVPSVYGSAYQRNLVEFPSLSSWVAEAFRSQFLVMAFVVAWFSARSANPRIVAWNTAWSAFAILMAFDLAYALLQNEISGKWLVENFVSNAVGSVFIAALLISILAAADFTWQHLPVGVTTRRKFAIIVVLCGGLLYCCVAYYMCELFYAPLSARFDISFSAPASGAIAKKQAIVAKETVKALNIGESDRPFSFAPQRSIKSAISWMSPPGKVIIHANFERERLPRIELRAVANCRGLKQIQGIDAGTDAWLSASGVSALEVIGDGGMTDFIMLSPPVQASTIKLDTGLVSMFNLDEEASQKTLRITQFVDETASLEVRSRGTMKFFLGLPLIAGDDSKVTLAPRLLTLRIGEHTQVIRLTPPKSIGDVPEHTGCRVLTNLQPLHVDRDGDRDLQHAGALIGVLVSISEPVDPESMSAGEIGIKVSGSGGWITLSGLQQDAWRDAELGRLSMLNVRGNLSEILIDDVVQVPRNVEIYTAVGDFQAHSFQGGLRIWGQAKWLWRDQGRLNSTKWEKLSWEPRLLIVSSFLAVIGFLVTAISRRLRANHEFSWMH